MPLYEITVLQECAVEAIYSVDADDEVDANEQYAQGNADHEWDAEITVLKTISVLSVREVGHT